MRGWSSRSGWPTPSRLPEEAILRRAAVGHKGPKDPGVPYGAWALPGPPARPGASPPPAGDLLTYARTHLDDASLSGMRQPRREMPPGLRRSRPSVWRGGSRSWSGTEVIGHDGGTIGQCAALRVLPERGIAVCVLTNGDNGGTLNDRLLAEVLLEVADVEMPALPVPDPEAAPAGLERHAGRYERGGRVRGPPVPTTGSRSSPSTSAFGSTRAERRCRSSR